MLFLYIITFMLVLLLVLQILLLNLPTVFAFLKIDKNKYLKRLDYLHDKFWDIEYENKNLDNILKTVNFKNDLEPWLIDKINNLKNNEKEFSRFKNEYKKLQIFKYITDTFYPD